MSGKHRKRVVWCLKLSIFVLVGCLFDTLWLVVPFRLFVVDVSLLPPGLFFRVPRPSDCWDSHAVVDVYNC